MPRPLRPLPPDPIPRRSTTRSSIGPAPPSPLAHAFRHIADPDNPLKPEWRYYLVYVEYAANEGDEDMRKILSQFLSLPVKEQATIMPEQLCELTGVQPHTLFAAVSGQMYKWSRLETLMTVATQEPRVVRALADRAMDSRDEEGNVIPGSLADATLFLRGTGFIPSPKGVTVNMPMLPTGMGGNRDPVLVGSGTPNRNQGLIPAGRRVVEMERLSEAEAEVEADDDEES